MRAMTPATPERVDCVGGDHRDAAVVGRVDRADADLD